MTLALLHINDHCLRVIAENGENRAETGFCYSDDHGLVSGSAAYETAWTKPHLSNNRFWHELNQKPLSRKLKYARHHADMAYAQLCRMLSSISSPQVLLSVPASLDNEQLSILLGLIKAVPAEICGVIDGALLAAGPEHQLVLEMQLHQTVLTQLEKTGESIKISTHKKIPKLGVSAIYREVAMHVSERLITTNRHDPLYLPENQQQLYNAIPKALSQMETNSEAIISLDTPAGVLAVKLSNDDLTKILDPLSKELYQGINEYSPDEVLLGSGGGIVAAFGTPLANSNRANFDLMAQKGFSLVQSETISPIPLKRIVSLRSAKSEIIAVGRAATHLVNEGRAWRLDKPLSLWLMNTGVEIARGEMSDSDLIIHADGVNLKTLYKKEHTPIGLPKDAICGAWLEVGKYKLQLIDIHDA
ncbi:MAG: hypothetical protein CMK35_00130 [Porticoccaceae bacterium]|nr:hypothetical protein [Porticoccaceae bacterium]